MGLDIWHYYASQTISGDFIVIDKGTGSAATKYASLLVVLNVDEAGYPSNQDRHRVLYVRRVGYQRKGMERGFYDRYPPDLVTVDRRIVEAMYDLTQPDAREQFSTSFLDNWDEDRSLVVVSF